MRIRRAELFLVRIPLKLRVRHALAERDVTENLIVRLEDESGREGWGEGISRAYVTGETPADAYRRLREEILPRLCGLSIRHPGEVPDAMVGCIAGEEGHQSARCAAELALFDLAGKCFDRQASDWFGGVRRRSIRYGFVVPIVGADQLGTLLNEIKKRGSTHVKVKAEGDRVLQVLEEVRRVLGEGVQLAVDANGSWDMETATRTAQRMEHLGVAWIEQPLARGRETDVALLAELTSIPLMADESMTTLEEAERLIELGAYRLFNLRLSKLGGFVNSHRIAARAAEAGIGLQVGCQVGETAILSAAGRLLAASLPSYEMAEGSYGVQLLASDLSDRPFEFGKSGEGPVPEGPGLGITVVRQRLEELAVRAETVC